MLRHPSSPRPDPQLVRFLAGAACCAFGTAFACGARFIDPGADAGGAAMAHPVLAGVLFALAGDLLMALTLLPRMRRQASQRVAGSLLAVLGGNVLFASSLGAFAAYGLPTLGMLSGIYLAGFALRLFWAGIRPQALLAFAGVLGCGSYLAYGVAFGLPLPLWPSFIAG